MIAFGCAITNAWIYERIAGPGIALAAEASSQIFANSGSIARSYNLLLDQAAEYEDLEALVLVHQDAEITDRELCPKVRAALSDPEVGVVGSVGSVGAGTIAWWEGSATWDAFVAGSPHFAGAATPRPSLPAAPPGEVDTLFGFVMALSPWVVRNLRFDESLDPLHGYDFDLCLQVRAEGRKVVAADIGVRHNRPADIVPDIEAWIEAHMLAAEKWDDDETDWKARAQRAEAEAGLARLASASKLLQSAARAEVETAALRRVEDTISWRVTEPLRRVNALRRERAALRRG